MELQHIQVSKIKPAKYNPRKNLRSTDRAYQQIERSITEFGLVEPLVWNQRTGNLVGGHQRFKVLKAQGVKEILCSVVDLDEPQEKALNLALNKVGGEWDDEALKGILQDIDKELAEIGGFDEEEFNRLLDIATEQKEIIEDEAPEPPKVAITRPGDVWILGRHRLMCGDSTSADCFEKLMKNGKRVLALQARLITRAI
jgi:ParB-like chromosome segregation protein Spo0J